jgi:hypothetical protein
MRRSVWVLALLIMSGRPLDAGELAAEEKKESAPSKYRIEVVYVYETLNRGSAPESMLVIGRFGFRSVASLKEYIAALPEGAVVEWEPGCIFLGGELLSSPKELEDFREFCKQQGVELIIHMAG